MQQTPGGGDAYRQVDVCNTATVDHPESSFTSRLLRYLSDVARIRHHECDFPWPVGLDVVNTTRIELSGYCAEDVHRLRAQSNRAVPGSAERSNNSVDDEEEPDSFIVFEEDEASVHKKERSSRSPGDDSAVSHLVVPTSFVLTIGNPHVSSVNLYAEVSTVTRYPKDPPRITVRNHGLLTVRKLLKVQRIISRVVQQWKTGLLANPGLESLIDFVGHRLFVCRRGACLHTSNEVPSSMSVETTTLSEDSSPSTSRHRTRSNVSEDGTTSLQHPLWPLPLSLSRAGGTAVQGTPRPGRASCTVAYSTDVSDHSSVSRPAPRQRSTTQGAECFRTERKQGKRRSLHLKRRADSNLSAVEPPSEAGVSSEDPQMSRYLRDFEELEVLGVGAFGAVSRCRLRAATRHGSDEDAAFFAIKRIPLTPEVGGRRQDLALQREAASLAVLHHPHIVRYHSAWIEMAQFPGMTRTRPKPSHRHNSSLSSFSSVNTRLNIRPILHIQMEYCSGQTLRRAIDAGAFVRQPNLIWVLFRQILDGLACMHDHGLIHRDLKPCNIFLQSSTGGRPPDVTNLKDVHIKIGDFGLATSAGTHPSSADATANASSTALANVKGLSAGVGTKFYMSPEQERGGYYDSKADMFSLGVVLFELWHPPFKTGMERAVVLSRLLSESRELPSDFIKTVPHTVPVLLRQLLNPSPAERPSARSLLQSLLLPLTPAGEFQPVFDFICRHPFSPEAQLVTRALFRRQLNFQAEHPGHLDLRLLPPTSKTRWLRLIAVTDVHAQFEAVFRSRGAVRVEAPPILPRMRTVPVIVCAGPGTPQTTSGHRPHHVRSAADENAMTLVSASQARLNHRDMVFLDPHGTPLLMPNRLAIGLGRTAPSFLASGPGVCRRFCFQNVECSTPHGTSTTANPESHFHAFYDIGVRVFATLESDVRTLLMKSAAVAARTLRHQGSEETAKYLATLLCGPPPSSVRAVDRSILLACRELQAYKIVALFEAELVAVARQILKAAAPVLQIVVQFYWTHALLLPAILKELFDVPTDHIQSFAEELRWSTAPITKSFLYQKFLALDAETSGTRDSSGHGETQRDRREAAAARFHDLLTYSGSLEGLCMMIDSHVTSPGVVPILLEHVMHVSRLLACTGSRPAPLFSLTLPFDATMFGKGIVFIAAPFKTKPDDAGSSATTTPMESPQLHNASPVDQPSACGAGALTIEMFRDRLAVGGRMDVLVAALQPHHAFLRTGAFLGLELGAGTIISSLTRMLTSSVQSTVPAAGGMSGGGRPFSVPPGATGNSTTGLLSQARGPPPAQALKRLFDRPIPQVFIIVVRVEQQCYAANLRRQLLKRGIYVRGGSSCTCAIQCQRRVDRIVDTTQFRRRAKNSSPVIWVVQLRDHFPNGIAYKLQYYGQADRQPPETEMILDDSRKVVDYLVDYFTKNYTSEFP